MNIKHFMEAVPATGGLKANGVLNLLGRPQMHPLILLVRESFQNSWDQRLVGEEAPVYSVNGFELRGHRLESLKKIFNLDATSQLPLLDLSLDRDAINVVEIRDERTRGLDGPTRADQGNTGNYARFVLEIGRERSEADLATGGTYGFGKGSYFRLSRANTILIHSRCVNDTGEIETRFVGISLGNGFTSNGRSFTGRHFFGDIDGEGLIRPLLNSDADALAQLLGFGVSEGSTGTSILIVDFDPGVDESSEESSASSQITLRQAMECFRDQIVWQCWPRIFQLDDKPGVEVQVMYEGDELHLPRKDANPILRGLAETYQLALKNEGVALGLERPRLEIGCFATTEILVNSSSGLPTDGLLGFVPPTHHVAMLRAPRLVVHYFEGPRVAQSDVGWVGTFVASNDERVERALAKSEPPSHDAWDYANLQGEAKRIAKRVSVQLKQQLQQKFRPSPEVLGEQLPLVRIAGTLGSILAMSGFSGTDIAIPTTTPGGSGGTNGKAKVFEPTSITTVKDVRHGWVFEVAFEQVLPPTSKGWHAEVKAIEDGLRPMSDLPEGVELPIPYGLEVVLEDGTKTSKKQNTGPLNTCTRVTYRVPLTGSVAMAFYLAEVRE